MSKAKLWKMKGMKVKKAPKVRMRQEIGSFKADTTGVKYRKSVVRAK